MLDGRQLGHPLLPNSACVRNDVRLGEDLRLILVSGSNMSGKSTLLRTIGTNVVLALSGAPVCAESLRLSPMQVGTAMRIQDSLQDGKSLFYSVVSRLKMVVDLSHEDRPLLFLLDEILQGTNSHDRRVGAEGVIRKLVEVGTLGLVTTHDLALTEIVDSLNGQAKNCHFEDQLINGKMTFDYTIRPGVVQKSNALELMRLLGLDV
jgi:DNA mismatch repair ATPase MutS